MGSTVRDKHIRTNRRNRSARIDPNNPATSNKCNNGDAGNIGRIPAAVRPKNYQMALNSVSGNPNPNQKPDTNSGFEDSGWGYCTEEQLEEILLKNLELLYNEAIAKLMALGYDEDKVLRVILTYGHCYGGMDVLTNILHNTLAFLSNTSGEDEAPRLVCADLKELVEHSLECMVALLQQLRPQLSKGDAMWCLLMSDLHVGRATVMEIPVLPSNGNGNVSGSGNGVEIGLGSGSGNVVDSGSGSGIGSLNPEGGVVGNEGPVGVTPLCRFHGGWGFGNGGTSEFPMHGMNSILSCASEMALQKEIECPKRFNLSPSMKDLLKRNVAMFAAGFRANSKHFQSQSQACPSSLSGVESSTGSVAIAEGSVGQAGEPQYVKNQEVVNSVMTKFKDLNLDENSKPVSLDRKDEMILNLVHQIKDLEKQVQERKEWAHQKAMQAARKLCNDLTELKTLRMEREETQRLKKGKQTLEDSTMKRLSEMENSLRKASGQVDRANAAVRKLETENAEIRAEMECNKLNASESVKTCLEAAKREKKHLKRLLQWEKQKAKIQEEIAAEQQKIADSQQELEAIEAATKEAEAKWRQEQKSREQAGSQVEEERRLKEFSEANNKRRLEALRLKVEIDFQRHKDDLQRLEQEFERLKENDESTELEQPNEIWTENSEGDSITRLLHELDMQDPSENEDGCDRLCMICNKDEVSVVFLPCAHLVICTNCNDSYPKKGKAACPYCRAPIEQRVRVYGASS